MNPEVALPLSKDRHRRGYYQEYRLKNLERVQEKERRYRLKNRERIREAKKGSWRKYREYYAEYGRRIRDELKHQSQMLNPRFMVRVDENPACPRCLSRNIQPLQKRRLGRYRVLKMFRCRSCGCVYTNGDGYKIPPEIRSYALQAHREGLPVNKIVKNIMEKFHLVVGYNTVKEWVMKFYGGVYDVKRRYLRSHLIRSLKAGCEGDTNSSDQLCDICNSRIVYDGEYVCSGCGVVFKEMNEVFEEYERARIYLGAFQDLSLVSLR